MSIVSSVPEDLAAALAAYRHAFGHAVPSEVVQLFALRVGPLVMEIRQAVALQKPVPAWLARSRLPSPTLYPEWAPGTPATSGSAPHHPGR
jgi:hypothetical protein